MWGSPRPPASTSPSGSPGQSSLRMAVAPANTSAATSAGPMGPEARTAHLSYPGLPAPQKPRGHKCAFLLQAIQCWDSSLHSNGDQTHIRYLEVGCNKIPKCASGLGTSWKVLEETVRERLTASRRSPASVTFVPTGHVPPQGRTSQLQQRGDSWVFLLRPSGSRSWH